MSHPPIYLRNPDVVLRRESPDSTLLFNPDNQQIRALNATGLFIWQRCDGTHDRPGIIRALGDHFDSVPQDSVEGEVSGFLDDMLTHGFIGILKDGWI